MLYSQGVALEDLGVPRVDGGPVETDPRKIWRLFAAHYHLFAGTPTRLWLDHSFETPVRPDRAPLGQTTPITTTTSSPRR